MNLTQRQLRMFVTTARLLHISRASEVLHQPSDAPPHDDHFHLRIRCTADERKADCVD